MLTILNTSILTAHGTYSYRPVTLDEAKAMVSEGFESAIGHQSTADVISTLLGVECPMNRVMYQQGPGDKALVFKLNGRPEEGKILSIEDIEGIGYSWGVLERTA
jgi:hypothetical protein